MFGKRYDHYSSSVFQDQGYTEIDASKSSWYWCDTCNARMPSGHICGQTKIASTSDPELAEDIDFWSVEAVLRGWHGGTLQREAKQRLRKGDYDPKNTKSTKWL